MLDEKNSLLKQCLQLTYPEGPAFEIKDNSDWDKFDNAKAINFRDALDFLNSLQFLRDAYRTTILEDLEIEYGIKGNVELTESERRIILAGRIYFRDGSGSDEDLQRILVESGFDEIQVHQNNPTQSMNIFGIRQFQMVAAGFNAYAGRPDAYAGRNRRGDELLINGFITQTFIPPVIDSHPFIFFVGGNVTRDEEGKIIEIESVDIPLSQELEFKRLILKFKPLFTWALLAINLVDDTPIQGYGTGAYGESPYGE